MRFLLITVTATLVGASLHAAAPELDGLSENFRADFAASRSVTAAELVDKSWGCYPHLISDLHGHYTDANLWFAAKDGKVVSSEGEVFESTPQGWVGKFRGDKTYVRVDRAGDHLQLETVAGADGLPSIANPKEAVKSYAFCVDYTADRDAALHEPLTPPADPPPLFRPREPLPGQAPCYVTYDANGNVIGYSCPVGG